MSKNSKLSLLLIIVVLAGVGFYFTPHLAVHNMKKAAELKDADTLSDYVDYPSLRESLKANFNAAMAKEMAKSNNTNPFEALGAALAAAFVNPMIDGLVSPEGLVMLMKGDKPNKATIDTTGNNLQQTSQSQESDIDTSMSYKGFNRFIVTVKKKNASDDPVEFIFKRDGFISWKLSALRFPQN